MNRLLDRASPTIKQRKVAASENSWGRWTAEFIYHSCAEVISSAAEWCDWQMGWPTQEQSFSLSDLPGSFVCICLALRDPLKPKTHWRHVQRNCLGHYFRSLWISLPSATAERGTSEAKYKISQLELVAAHPCLPPPFPVVAPGEWCGGILVLNLGLTLRWWERDVCGV